jgi:hypothetical protein
MSATLTNELAAASVLDPSDVPTVAVRELVLALKMLSAGGQLAIPQRTLTEDDLRRVEQAFWQSSKRATTRKVAVLLRLRSLLEAVQSRRLAELVSSDSQATLVHVLAAAATMRLNAKWGFNPLKLARAARDALAGDGSAGVVDGLAVAA